MALKEICYAICLPPIFGIKTCGNCLNILMVSLRGIILLQVGNSIFLSFQSPESLLCIIDFQNQVLALLLLFYSSAAFLSYILVLCHGPRQ